MHQLSELQQRQWGLTESHLQSIQQGGRNFQLDANVITPWQQLQTMAAKQGFDLQLVSAYRGFDRQKSIWQSKASGKRHLLDDDGQLLNFASLSERERLYAIMRWSAIPGLSRHHWGTDIDVFDANVMSIAEVQLTPEEVGNGGVFSPLHQWLDSVIESNHSLGFYRPYHLDVGGVAPERWHLSYLPVAKFYMDHSHRELLLALWQKTDLLLADLLANDIDTIYRCYVELPLDGQPEWVASMLSE